MVKQANDKIRTTDFEMASTVPGESFGETLAPDATILADHVHRDDNRDDSRDHNHDVPRDDIQNSGSRKATGVSIALPVTPPLAPMPRRDTENPELIKHRQGSTTVEVKVDDLPVGPVSGELLVVLSTSDFSLVSSY